MNYQELAICQLFNPEWVGQSDLTGQIYYYSKNTESEYIDCNAPVAHSLSLSSLHDIKGKNDQSFGWNNERIWSLREHDLVVMKDKSAVCKVEDSFLAPNGKLIQLISYKIPLYDGDRLIGITGISFDILSSHFLNHDNLVALKKVYASPDQLHNYYPYNVLTTRERECVQLYLEGKTSKETAIQLDLSFRTVEEYFVNIKSKLGLKYKRDLLAISNNINLGRMQ